MQNEYICQPIALYTENSSVLYPFTSGFLCLFIRLSLPFHQEVYVNRFNLLAKLIKIIYMTYIVK